MINRKWELFQRGMIRAEWKGLADGAIIDWTDENGLTLFVFYRNPSPDEIKDFESDMAFEVAFKDVEGVGFFAFKFGKQEWADCAFSPNLYDDAPKFEEIEKGKTYALNVMLIDTGEGQLKVLRTIALGKEFAEHFRKWCLNSLKKDISRDYYDLTVDAAFRQFPLSESIANSADVRWTRPHGEDIRRSSREEKE